MRRKLKLGFYLIGILICLAELQFQAVSSYWKNTAIRKVQILALEEKRDWDHHWMGIEMQQYPADLMAYAELLYQLRPEFVIETGTYHGATSVYLAGLMEKIRPQDGKVVTVDIVGENWEQTVKSGKVPEGLLERITFIKGDSVGQETLRVVSERVRGKSCFVILDSYHAGDHVLKELRLYSQFVPVGGYIIVNDTHLEQLGAIRESLWTRLTKPEAGNGPFWAVERFLETASAFEVDNRFPTSYLSCAPNGFLKRIK
jgi:cephalosporin hydroxylase